MAATNSGLATGLDDHSSAAERLGLVASTDKQQADRIKLITAVRWGYHQVRQNKDRYANAIQQRDSKDSDAVWWIWRTAIEAAIAAL